MCGIFGVVGFQFNKIESARESLDTLKHRGPDQSGEYFDGRVYVGHRRLSILDLSEHGRQPMISKTNDLVISVNGEIYNFTELKNLLKEKYEFVSTSDSEVILHGYKEWGIKGLLKRIEGMYAISVYDKLKDRVFLVRDRVGIKPMYYAVFNDCIVWASELKAIELYLKDYNLETDNSAIYDFLTYSYIPAPKTKYKNIYKLRPAYYLSVSTVDLSIKTNRYWEIKLTEQNFALPEAKEQLKYLIRKSVREQMMSDVPIGFFLSGGLDSSTVVGFASELSNDLKTFSIGFDVSEHSELKYAEKVSKIFHIQNYSRVLSFTDALELISSLNKWYDEPFGDLSALPTFLVSEFAKESVTVILSGDGGDEIFGGYNWYDDRVVSREKNFNSKVLNNILSLIRNRYRFSLLGTVADKLQLKYFLPKKELILRYNEALLKNEKQRFRKELNIPEDYNDYWVIDKYSLIQTTKRKKLQYIDFNTYLPDDILTKVDRVSMAVSLEVRVPLLSTELVEFMFSLPESLIYYKGMLKGLMKETVKEFLPDEIVYRKKKGFSIPYKKWVLDGFFDGKPFQKYLLDKMKS